MIISIYKHLFGTGQTKYWAYQVQGKEGSAYISTLPMFCTILLNMKASKENFCYELPSKHVEGDVVLSDDEISLLITELDAMRAKAGGT